MGDTRHLSIDRLFDEPEIRRTHHVRIESQAA
jgi:hypothetical protein